jgi:DNA invertase Pin-like site-specific DNA recombinase
MKKPRAYSYIRMSTDIQLKGDSLRRQEQLSRQYADEFGLDLDVQFQLSDIGYSAYTGENLQSGELGLFLSAVKAGQIPKGSYLLIEAFDRLSRQAPTSAIPIFLDLINNGINVVTLTDRQVYKAGETQLTQLLVSIVGMSRAYEESRIKGERVGKAWSNKRENATSTKLTSICPAWLKLSEDRSDFEIISDRDKIVKRIFEESVAGIGAFSITKRLNGDKVAPFGKSRGWIQSYVTKILKNRAVLGDYQPHKIVNGKRVPEGDVVERYYPQIIEPELYYKVQSMRRERSASPNSGRKGEQVSNLFTHIAKCDYCGEPMRFVNKGRGPKGGTYLKCAKSISGRGCIETSWRYSDFEKSFLYFTSEIDLDMLFRASSLNSERQAIEARSVEISERIHDAEAKRERIFETIQQSIHSTSYLSKKIDEIQIEIDQLEADLSSLKSSIPIERASISSDELRDKIKQLQEGQHANYRDRAAVSARLRELIKSLSIAVKGREPALERIRLFLDENEPDGEYREKLFAHISESYRDNGSMNKTFTVRLADETTRVVVVDPSDPTKFSTYLNKSPFDLTYLRALEDRIENFDHFHSDPSPDSSKEDVWKDIDWDA